MATITGQSGNLTRRSITFRGNFERYAYTFMRMSGIALLILAVGHMLIQHVLNSTANLTIQFVAVQWKSWGWKAYDMLLLAFAISHGINGLRNVLEDYIHNRATMAWINRFLVVFVIATIAWAGYAIANFDATRFIN
jgi:succinate dehydrogenase / fumarate reductase, membrane anchor subunit